MEVWRTNNRHVFLVGFFNGGYNAFRDYCNSAESWGGLLAFKPQLGRKRTFIPSNITRRHVSDKHSH